MSKHTSDHDIYYFPLRAHIILLAIIIQFHATIISPTAIS